MHLKNYVNNLKLSDLFRDFDTDDILDFFNNSDYSIKNYGKDDLIFIEDEKCTNLSFVLSGMVEIQKIDASGKVLTVAQFTDGDNFGENLIFGDRNVYPMTVVSKAKTIVLHIPKNSVAKLCQTNSTFLNEFLRTLSNRAVNLSSKLKEVTLKTIRQKICEFLYFKYKSTGNTSIGIEMSKKEWADKIGVQRPSLSRELIKMKEEDLIDYDKDVIIIKDIDGVEACL